MHTSDILDFNNNCFLDFIKGSVISLKGKSLTHDTNTALHWPSVRPIIPSMELFNKSVAVPNQADRTAYDVLYRCRTEPPIHNCTIMSSCTFTSHTSLKRSQMCRQTLLAFRLTYQPPSTRWNFTALAVRFLLRFVDERYIVEKSACRRE